MAMRIKIPARAAQYVIDLGTKSESGPSALQAKLASLDGTDKILVTDDEDLVDELRNAVADLIADSILRRKEGDPDAKLDASAAAKTINHIDQAEERKKSPKASAPKYDHYELYDAGNNMETAQYQTFAAAIQVARGKKWRDAKWRISGSDGTVLRKYNEQEEVDYRAALPEPKPKPVKKDAPVIAEKAPVEATTTSTNGNGRSPAAKKTAPAKVADRSKTSRTRTKAGASA